MLLFHILNLILYGAIKINLELWLQCVKLMENKQHLTQDGFNKILSLKSALNLGLSDNLQSTF